MYIILAWRNIWRNSRRTVVILIAVVIGIWSMVFLGALMQGLLESMVDNGITTLTGHIQIHRAGYRSDPVVGNRIADPGNLEEVLERELPPGSHWAPRVRVGAIASNARHSAGVTLVGIDPVREAAVSFIGAALVEGSYLKADARYAILAGEALVGKFETRRGNKLVLMSQDTKNEIASRAFRIAGLYRAEMEATEKQFLFVALNAAQEMLKLGEGISEISILLPEREETAAVARRLAAALPPLYAVETWQELLPILAAYLKINRSFVFLWYLVVFIAMGFGIVNTMLMAVMERMREFGLLKALGMKPRRIVAEVLTESLLLLLIGMIIGNGFALGSVALLARRGIDLSAMAAGLEYAGMSRMIYPALSLENLITANLVVLLLGLLISLYPALKASRISPVEAMVYT